jgi:hypothetical protein
MFPALLIGPLLLLWVPMARTRRTRWTVAAGLAVLTAVAAQVTVVFPRAVFEATLVALIVAGTVIAAATVAEQRSPQPPRIWWLRTLFVVFLLLALCLYGAMLRPAPFFPAAGEVLPLPAGLNATVVPYGDGDCGSGACTRTITIAGRPGQSADELRAEVERHLAARDWGTGCRPVGWILHRATECVEVTGNADQLTVSLSGLRSPFGT